MALEPWYISDWSDLADLVAILSFPILIATVIMSGGHITKQLNASRKEASFEVYLQLSDRYAEIAALRRELNARFDRSDKALNEEEIHNFYSQYWILQTTQWEMFRSGLLPVDIYVNWLSYLHDNIHGAFGLNYFKADGSVGRITSGDAFHQTAVKRMLRGHDEGLEFFQALASIPHTWSKQAAFSIFDAPDRDKRRAAILELLKTYRARYKAASVWELH